MDDRIRDQRQEDIAIARDAFGDDLRAAILNVILCSDTDNHETLADEIADAVGEVLTEWGKGP